MRVGDCDTSAVGCWLDTRSVQNVLSDAPGLLNETLDKVKLDYVDKLEDLTPAQVDSALKKDITGDIKKWDTASLDKAGIDKNIKTVINDLKAVAERGGASNPQKAKALLRIGQIYDEIARKIYSRVIELAKKGKTLEDAEAEKLAEKSPITFYEFNGIASGIKVNGKGTDLYLEEGKKVISLKRDKFIDEDVGYYTVSTGKWTFYDSFGLEGDEKLIKEYFIDKKISYVDGNFVISSLSGEVLLRSSKSYAETLKIGSLDEALTMIKSLSGDYEDNSDNKNFVDSLCTNKIVSESDCQTIKGRSMSFVEEFLKKIKEREFYSGDITSDVAYYEFNGHSNGVQLIIEYNLGNTVRVINTTLYLDVGEKVISLKRDKFIDEDVGYYTVSTGKWTFYDSFGLEGDEKLIKEYFIDKVYIGGDWVENAN